MSRDAIVDQNFPVHLDPAAFPFRREVTLAPLAAAWSAPGKSGVKAALLGAVQEALRKAPELLEPIHDLAIISRHRELVEVLMTKVFPSSSWDRDLGAAILPFSMQSFYVSPTFERLLGDEQGGFRGRINLDPHTMGAGKLLKAYGLILRKFYGIELTMDYPIIGTTTDPESGLERHFSLQYDPRFLEVEAVGAVPPLSEADRRRLLANLGDPDLLLELIPPGSFVFRGFGVIRALDVTDQEILSSLKRDLIERESIVSNARFQSLQDKLCTFLRRTDLRLGVAAIRGDQVFVLNYGHQFEHSCLFADSAHHSLKEFAGSVYERASRQGQPLVIADLATYADRTCIEDGMLERGLRSM